MKDEKDLKPNKAYLFGSLFDLIIGLLAIISYIILFVTGEKNMIKWTLSFLLGVSYFVIGIRGLIAYFKYKRK